MEETSSNLRRAYGESLRQLDDLRRLGGHSVAPLAGQIQYHLASMLAAAESPQLLPLQHQNLNSIFQEKVSQILSLAFAAGEGVKSISEYYDSQADFSSWENLLNYLPSLCDLAKAFDPQAIEMRLEKDGITINLIPGENESASSYRKQAYRFTQELWQKSALLTYKIAEHNSRPWVNLEMRFADLKTQDSCFAINSLEFDPIFSHYLTGREEVKDIGPHHIVSIDENAVVTLHNKIPEQDNSEQTFIHLPFLFRPLSLIISGRGMLQAKHAKNSRVELFDLFR